MPIEEAIPPPGGNFVVDLPYGKSILVAGIDNEEAKAVLGDDTRFETRNRDEVHGLLRAGQDVAAVIIMEGLYSQDAFRLRRNATSRHVRVIGEHWTTEQLREWKQKVAIHGLPSVDEPEPQGQGEDEEEADVSPVKPERARWLERRRDRSRGGHYWKPGSGRRKASQPVSPELKGSIVVVGVRRFDLSNKRRWILADEQVAVWSVCEIKTTSRLSVNARFVVYDPDELGSLKTAVWEKIISQHHDQLQVYEVEGASEMFEVTRNLIEFGVHPLPASVVDGMRMDSRPDEDEELSQTATETEEGVIDMHREEQGLRNFQLPLGQKALIVARDIHHLAHSLGKLQNGGPCLWELWGIPDIVKAGKAPEQVSLDNIACVVFLHGLQGQYEREVRRMMPLLGITKVFEAATINDVLIAFELLLNPKQDGEGGSNVRISKPVSLAQGQVRQETDVALLGSGVVSKEPDAVTPQAAPTAPDTGTAPELQPQPAQPPPDTAPITTLYTANPPMALSVSAGQLIYLVGINQQAELDLQGYDSRFVRVVPSGAAKILTSWPPDMGAAVLLKSVTEPLRTQICEVAAGKKTACIAIPDWGVPQLRDWVGSAKFSWDVQTADVVGPSEQAISAQTTEDAPTHTDPVVFSDAATEALPEEASPILEVRELVEAEEPETGDRELQRKYQAAVQRNAELERQVQTLSAKVRGLEQLVDELSGDN